MCCLAAINPKETIAAFKTKISEARNVEVELTSKDFVSGDTPPPNPTAAEQSSQLVAWLYCSDIERSFDFYVAVLGFTSIGEPRDDSAYLGYRGARLMLQQPADEALLSGELEHPYGRGVHLLLEADSVDSLYAKTVSQAEGAVFVEPRNKWYRIGEDLLGHREFVIQDPDGYLLRFFQRLEGLEDA